MRWAHVCTGAREDEGRWTVIGPFQVIPLKPEFGGRFHHADFATMLEADEQQALAGHTATLDLIRGDSEVVFGEDDIPLEWRPIASGYPYLASIHRHIGIWPLKRTGRYRMQLSVHGQVLGCSQDFFAVSAAGPPNIPPRAGVRRRGFRLSFAHFAREAGAPNGIPYFQEFEEYRLVPGPGPHLVRGMIVGALMGGTEDPRYRRCHVELRLPDGTVLDTSPERQLHFQAAGKGHEIGGMFWFERPAIHLPPADYRIVVILEGEEIGGIDYPLIQQG